MEEAAERRGTAEAAADFRRVAGLHEQAFRVIGHWIDQQKPKDVFLFEQEGAYVVRLNMGGQAGVHHELAEFTRDDVEELVAQAPSLRNQRPTGGLSAGRAPARDRPPLPGHNQPDTS